MKKVYEFNITIAGEGSSVDEAFQNALDTFKENPEIAIQEEVIYVVRKEEVGEEVKDPD
jgi:hypothetical protein